MVSWKSGSREGPPRSLGALLLFRLLWRKGGPKVAFLKTLKIENGTPKHFFRKVRHWDPLRTVLGSGFKKHEKTMKTLLENQWFLMVQNHSKVLKKQMLLSWCQMGTQTSCFWIQNGDMGLPGSTYPLIFDVLVWCQKMMIFGRPPAAPKKMRKICLILVSVRVCRKSTLLLASGVPRAAPFLRTRNSGKRYKVRIGI